MFFFFPLFWTLLFDDPNYVEEVQVNGDIDFRALES